MNRLEMAEEVARRVPLLAKNDQDHWEETERLRARFVSDYPIRRIPKLDLDDYVIGKGPQSRSFCYRLERELQELGFIFGATAFKFGIYFGRTRQDPKDEYRFRPHWGHTRANVFAAVKQAIVDLLEAAANRDLNAIAENPLSPMVKGKLLFLYQPEEYAPIYSSRHLEHFVAALNLPGKFEAEWEMQRALMNYRAQFPLLKAESPILYMWLLYELFGYPPHQPQASATGTNAFPILNDAVKGAEFIQQLPTSASTTGTSSSKREKRDYEKYQRRCKHIGDRGEAIVFELEQQRLRDAGKSALAKRVQHVSQDDDSLATTSFHSTPMERNDTSKLKRLPTGIWIVAFSSQPTKWTSPKRFPTSTFIWSFQRLAQLRAYSR
jgi:hypothetical protein